MNAKRMLGTSAILGAALSFGVGPAHAVGCGVTEPLSALISGTSISCGGLTFSNFGQYFATATGGAPVVTADSISVFALSGTRADGAGLPGGVALAYLSPS